MFADSFIRSVLDYLGLPPPFSATRPKLSLPNLDFGKISNPLLEKWISDFWVSVALKGLVLNETNLLRCVPKTRIVVLVDCSKERGDEGVIFSFASQLFYNIHGYYQNLTFD